MRVLSPVLNLLLEERARWFAWLPVAMGIGIALYFMLAFEPSPLWFLLTPVAIITFILTRQFPYLQTVITILLAVSLGFNVAQLETRVTGTIMMDREVGPVGISGRLLLAEALPDGARLLLDEVQIGRIPAGETPQQIRLKVKQPFGSLPPAGSWLDLYGAVGAPSSPVAPAAFDFRRQAYFQGIGGIGWTYGAIKIAESKRPPDWLEQIKLGFEDARRTLAARVAQVLEGRTAAMVTALLTGSQTGIDKEIMQAMRASGLAHLLSISGIHVSMVGLLIYWPLRSLMALFPWLALRFPIKKWAAGIAILGTFGYTLLVGVQTPTLRSALMTSILMLAIMLDRRVLSMRLVALSALAVLTIFPSGLLGPSFQMSFAAVLAMVALYEKPLDTALRQGEAFSLPLWVDFLRKHAGSVIMTSLAATAATTPFSLYHFQSFSFYGVIANMIAIPLTSFWIMPCLLLTTILTPFGWEALPLQGAGLGVDVIIIIAQQIATWPYAILHLPAMPHAAFIAIVLGGLWLCLWRRRWRWFGIVPIVIGMIYPLYTNIPDVLIDEGGTQWAVRLDDGRYAVADSDKDKFTLTQWQQRLGFPELVEARSVPPENDRLQCDPAGCVYQRHGHSMALVARAESLPEDCTRATHIITPHKIRRCAAATVWDGKVFRQHGAHSIEINSDGALHIMTARAATALRPWYPDYQVGESVVKP